MPRKAVRCVHYLSIGLDKLPNLVPRIRRILSEPCPKHAHACLSAAQLPRERVVSYHFAKHAETLGEALIVVKVPSGAFKTLELFPWPPL